MKLSLSILIPCYNVASTVETAVTDAWRVGRKSADQLEIIVIDDGSDDATNKILRRIAPKIPCLVILNHDRNMGYGATIRELYETGKHEWLFTLPGDHQYEAQELLKLLPKTSSADMILGWRKYRSDPPMRLIQSRVYNSLLNALFHLGLHDVNTIRLMKRSVIRSVTLTSSSAFVDAELAIRAKKEGFTIVEVPVTHKPRVRKGATGGNIWKTILPTIGDMIRSIGTL